MLQCLNKTDFYRNIKEFQWILMSLEKFKYSIGSLNLATSLSQENQVFMSRDRVLINFEKNDNVILRNCNQPWGILMNVDRVLEGFELPVWASLQRVLNIANQVLEFSGSF